jgi:hypothetical protein
VEQSGDAGTGPGSTGSDSEPVASADSEGGASSTGESTGEPPEQTWCVEIETFPEVGFPHAANLDGGSPESWNEIAETDPESGEPTTRFIVQRFDGETFVTVDELTRPGHLVTFADVDGDGRDDAIQFDAQAGTASWLPGLANGQLAETGLPAEPDGLENAMFVDLDNDAAVDAIVHSPDSPSGLDFYIGEGNGSFAFAGAIDVGIEYFTFDARTEDRRIVLGAEYTCIGFCAPYTEVVVVELAEDDTPLEIGRVPIAAYVRFIDVIDRNGDDLPDLLLELSDDSQESMSVAWYDSPEYGELVHIEATALLDAADVDLDGAVDVIEAVSSDDPVEVRFGVSGQGLGPPHPLVGSDVPDRPVRFGSAQADYDGDGRLDFVVPSADDTMALWTIVPCQG